MLERDKELSRRTNEDMTEFKRKLGLYNEIQKTIDQIGHNKIGTESFMPLESILHY
jgi:cell division control protein 7